MTRTEEFHAACLEAIEECRQLGYYPTAWAAMIKGPGGATAAAKRLLTRSQVQYGFERLIRMGRADLTVEHAVLLPQWSDLFGELYRERAQRRLDMVRLS